MKCWFHLKRILQVLGILWTLLWLGHFLTFILLFSLVFLFAIFICHSTFRKTFISLFWRISGFCQRNSSLFSPCVLITTYCTSSHPDGYALQKSSFERFLNCHWKTSVSDFLSHTVEGRLFSLGRTVFLTISI